MIAKTIGWLIGGAVVLAVIINTEPHEPYGKAVAAGFLVAAAHAFKDFIKPKVISLVQRLKANPQERNSS